MYVSICGEKIHPTAQPPLNARTDNELRQVGGRSDDANATATRETKPLLSGRDSEGV